MYHANYSHDVGSAAMSTKPPELPWTWITGNLQSVIIALFLCSWEWRTEVTIHINVNWLNSQTIDTPNQNVLIFEIIRLSKPSKKRIKWLLKPVLFYKMYIVYCNLQNIIIHKHEIHVWTVNLDGCQYTQSDNTLFILLNYKWVYSLISLILQSLNKHELKNLT